MASRSTQMQAIFSELTEKNKEIVILVARSIQVAQNAAEEPRKPPVQIEAGTKGIAWKNCKNVLPGAGCPEVE